MKRRARRRSFSGGLLAVAVAVAACGTSGDMGAAEGEPTGSVFIASGLDQAPTDAVVNGFEEAYPGVEVEAISRSIEETLTRIETEIQATGEIQADVVWSADRLAIESFKDRGLLVEYAPEGTESIPADLADPDDFWHVSVPFYVYLMYNTDRVSEEDAPTSWEDLADPRWQGMIGLSDPSVSGSALALTYALAQEHGWDWWERVAENNPRISPSTVSLLTGASSGEFSIVPTVDSLVLQALEDGSPVSFVIPEEGVVVTETVAALTTNAQDPELAMLFLDYLFSEDAAMRLAEVGYFTARTDIERPFGLPAIEETDILAIDWEAFDAAREDTKERFRQIMQD